MTHPNPNCIHEVLDWIKRTEMADSSMSTSSIAFNQLCWPKLHGNVKWHNIGKLNFSHKFDDEGNSRCVLQKNGQILIPIATISPPEYITGVEQIDFDFVDGQALKFVQAILPLLNNITIKFCRRHEGFEDKPKIGPISRLVQLLAGKTYKLEMHQNTDVFDRWGDEQIEIPELVEFNKKYPNFIDGISLIRIDTCRDKDMNEVLMKWLKAKNGDNKPKLLNLIKLYSFEAENWMNELKKEFLDSTEPIKFIIRIEDTYGEEALNIFKLKNKIGEILELFQSDQNADYYFIVRCSKKDGQQRKDWEAQFERKLGTTILMP